MIELVVVIGVVLMLVGILLPALRRSREGARDSRELSVVRSNIASVMTYASNYKDFFPSGKGPSFIHASGSWVGCLLEAGMIGSIAEMEPGGMRFSFSYVAFVDPLGVQRGHIKPESMTPYEPQRLGSVRYPSAKGLIWPTMRHFQPSLEIWCCGATSAAGAIGFADGSAGLYRWTELTEPEGAVTEFWAGLPVVSTWGGVFGIDRRP